MLVAKTPSACDAPDKLSDVAQHRRENAQTGRKGAYQCKMTNPAIGPFLRNATMGANLRRHPAAVSGTDSAIAPWGDQQRGCFLSSDEDGESISTSAGRRQRGR